MGILLVADKSGGVRVQSGFDIRHYIRTRLQNATASNVTLTGRRLIKLATAARIAGAAINTGPYGFIISYPAQHQR